MNGNALLKTRVGVIGPEEAVKTALRVAQEFPALDLVPISYENEEEASALANEYQDRMDVIVFMGPVPYYLARSSLELRTPHLFVRPIGANLLRTLFDLAYHQDIDLSRISVDTLSRQTVEECFSEIGLPSDGVFSKEYRGPVVAQDLISFHHELWSQGRTSAALTGLRSAWIGLQALGVRAFWIRPVKAAVRDALRLAMAEGDNLRSKTRQIVVCICNVDGFGQLVKQRNSQYQTQRLKLALYDILNSYAEGTQSWVHELEGDEFVIFMTRGILEEDTNYYQSWPLLDHVRRELPITVRLGVGLGQTAHEAGTNARVAINLAKHNGGDCAFVVDLDGKSLGPLGRGHKLEAVLRTQDEHLLLLAKRARLSVSTVSKLDSLLATLRRTTVTAPELARWFNFSLRSARRLLATLEETGLSSVVGEEQPVGSGRPRRVFSIHLDREPQGH